MSSYLINLPGIRVGQRVEIIATEPIFSCTGIIRYKGNCNLAKDKGFETFGNSDAYIYIVEIVHTTLSTKGSCITYRLCDIQQMINLDEVAEGIILT